MDVISRTLAIGSRVKEAIADGWENIFTGLGVMGKDKRTGGRIKYLKYGQAILESAHDADDIAHRVVNKLPDEGTQKWLHHKLPKGQDDVKKAIVDDEDRLKIKSKTNKSWKWSRLYGGAGMYLAVTDGLTPDQPLNFNRIMSLDSITVLHRFELQAGRLNDNINDPNFGLPEFYTVNPRGGVSINQVHHSRIIRFEGSELSEQQFKNNDYWNDSVITKLYEILRDYNAAYASAAHTVQDFNVTILKLKNLADIIGGDKDDLVTSRLKLMNLSKSILGSVLIDAENEEFTNLATPLTGLPQTLDKLDQRLVSATGMPHTVILGDGAAGTLSGKGESEDKSWKALVASEQTKTLTDPLDYLYKVMFAAKKGPTKGLMPKDWSYDFCELYEPSAKEKAEVKKITAETDVMYINTQVLAPVDVTKSRFGGDEYSTETTVDMDAINEQIETEKEVAEQNKQMEIERHAAEIEAMKKKTAPV